ncbi:prepilin-type N-terminal cleavage/methylation domain-containing protein [Actimicrobium sp. GrIS 1.19]|uniref:type II secretion system protein n=1 Tax=Actimicrobium sp. GrIS 1.19 TaxID=3071708 RepID=UPI002E07E84B|nr:prepilin-type N-terminal cleavage/methylation domain-containing protein [Actimicrobium sp. GrIS 1.19]
MMRARQNGVTLIELLVGLAIAGLLMAPLMRLLSNTAALGAVNADQQALQQQVQFAMQRIALQVGQGTNSLLPPKADNTSSGTWLNPALYDLRAGSVAGTLALTETIAGVSHVLAEPVGSFSITSPPVTAGQTLIVVSITLARGDLQASATQQMRLGGAR